MKFGIPQILLIILFAASWGMNVAKSGEPKKGTYSGTEAFIAGAIEFGLLYWGGFFK
jgi:hypothetical protein